MAGLRNANVVRTVGGIFTLAGGYWAFQGIHLIVRLLR
jgi:hypothetical protein